MRLSADPDASVPPPEPRRAPTIAVIGGGLAGLTVVHRLLHSGARLTGDPVGGPRFKARIVILEREGRLGGKILTESFDGFVVEGAADSFLARKPWARALVGELGIAEELVGSQPGRPRAFVRRAGSLVPFPDGLTGLVPTRFAPLWASGILSPLGFARVTMERWVPKRTSDADETVASFVRRRFGDELYERLMQPLLGGLYGSSPEELSVEATFPVLAEAERTFGSVTRGLAVQARERAREGGGKGEGAPFLSLRGGMGALIDALKVSVGSAEVRMGIEAKAVRRSGDGWAVEVRDHPPIAADAVVITAPAPVAARLLEADVPEVAAALTRIPFTSTSVVTAAYDIANFPRALTGHGYLNPLSEGRKVAGVTWSSRKFAGRAPHDRVLLRGFIRDPHLTPPGLAGDERLLAILAEELYDAVGLEAEPLWWRVFRWENSMPAYTVGHLARVRTIQRRVAELPGLFLAGCSYAGVGIPDTIRSAEDAALRLMKYVR